MQACNLIGKYGNKNNTYKKTSAYSLTKSYIKKYLKNT